MKAIFTGTEQDLIEAGFEKFDYDYSKKQNLNPPEYIRLGIRNISAGYNWVIQIKNNIIKSLKCYRTHTEKTEDVYKSFIQDLIDKNLVRFEKE